MKKLLLFMALGYAASAMAYNPVVGSTSGTSWGDTSGLVNWCPGFQQNQYWNNPTQEWKNAEYFYRTYNDAGVCLFEKGPSYIYPTKFVYDETGRLVEELLGSGTLEDYKADYKYVYTYDEVVADNVTSKLMYMNVDGQWLPTGSGWMHYIRRNADGTVNRLGYINMYANGSNWDQSWKDYFDIAYNADGEASKITHFQWINGAWTPTEAYDAIEWIATDGQFVNLWDDRTLFQGANKMKAASYPTSREVPVVGTVTVEYPGPEGDFSYSIEARDTVLTARKYVQLDDHGSWSEECTTRYDYHENPFDDDEYTWTQEFNYDKFGLLLGMSFVEKCEGVVSRQKFQRGLTEYDPESGFPTDWVLQEVFDFETLEWGNSLHKTFSDYKVGTGVCAPAAEGVSSPEYYTLDGRRVLNPGAGVYIVREGNSARKIVKSN